MSRSGLVSGRELTVTVGTWFIVSKTPFLATCTAVALFCPEMVEPTTDAWEDQNLVVGWYATKVQLTTVADSQSSQHSLAIIHCGIVITLCF